MVVCFYWVRENAVKKTNTKSLPFQPPQNPPNSFLCQNPEYSFSAWALGWGLEIEAVLLRGAAAFVFQKTCKAMMATKPKLHYPNGRGRMESVRWVLAAAGVEVPYLYAVSAQICPTTLRLEGNVNGGALSSPTNITDLLQWVRRVLPLKTFSFYKWSVVDEIVFNFQL